MKPDGGKHSIAVGVLVACSPVSAFTPSLMTKGMGIKTGSLYLMD